MESREQGELWEFIQNLPFAQYIVGWDSVTNTYIWNTGMRQGSLPAGNIIIGWDTIPLMEEAQTQQIAVTPVANNQAIPNLYSIHGTEDFYRAYWLSSGGTPTNFSVEAATNQFSSAINNQLYNFYDEIRYARQNGIELPPLPPALRELLAAEDELNAIFAEARANGSEMPSIYEALGWDFNQAVYASLETYQYLGEISDHWNGEEANITEAYTENFLYAENVEQSGTIDLSTLTAFNPNLMEQQYEDRTYQELLTRIYQMLQIGTVNPEYVASLGIDLPSLSESDIFNYFANSSYEDLIALAQQLVETYPTDTNFMVSGSIADGETLRIWLAEIAEDYRYALVLDIYRQFVYDPSWVPAEELEQLNTLQAEINLMVTSILGVDISWVKAGFQEFHDAMLGIHQWRVSLKAQMDTIELTTLVENTTAENNFELFYNLYQLLQIPISILFPPAGLIFAAVDILQGVFQVLKGDASGLISILLGLLDAGLTFIDLPNHPSFSKLVDTGIINSDEFINAQLEFQSSVTRRQVQFETNNDYFKDYIGTADINSPEIVTMITRMKAKGVRIILSDNTASYLPHVMVRDNSSILVVDKFIEEKPVFTIYREASMSTWLHEFQHFLDDEKLGFRTMQSLIDDPDYPKIMIRSEFNAYSREVEYAFELYKAGRINPDQTNSILGRIRDGFTGEVNRYLITDQLIAEELLGYRLTAEELLGNMVMAEKFLGDFDEMIEKLGGSP
jgi:hypothetical protein